MKKSLTLGQEVKRLRLAKSMTQVQVATLCGITQGFLGGVERGAKPHIGAEVLYRLSDALGVPVEHWRPWILPPAPAPAPAPKPEPETKKPTRKRAKK